MLALILLGSQLISSAQSSPREDLSSRNIKLSGWAREFLVRQDSGLTGFPEASGFPFNTGMWTTYMDFRDREYPGGTEWWPYEQTAFYLDGALRCGYMIGSEKLINRAKENINYVIDHLDEEGKLRVGNITDDSWALVLFMTLLFEEYEANLDKELLTTIENHYRSVYSTAEKLYSTFQNAAIKENNNQLLELSALGMRQGMVHYGHGFTYSEFVKLTAVLYYYTRKEEYREALENAMNILSENHELASGIQVHLAPRERSTRI